MKRVFTLFIAFAVFFSAFVTFRPVVSSAADMIDHKIVYSGKYVRLTLMPKNSSDTIRYTSDGTIPTLASTKYTKTLRTDSKVTVKAIEFDKNGNTVASICTILCPKVYRPDFTMTSAGRLRLSCYTENAKICYTTDGSIPTEKSKVYKESIYFKEGMTIKARAYKTGMKPSLTAVFTGGVRQTYTEDLLDLINIERKEAGYSELELDKKLCNAAEIRVKELTKLFEHKRPDGSRYYTVLESLGLVNVDSGENIAKSTVNVSAEEIMEEFMDSASHRKNILGKDYKKTGIAVLIYGNTKYWVTLFMG